jgi:tetratricopeptide (TPR) repeat protein
MLAYRQGDYGEVAQLCGEALEIGQAIGDMGAVAFALHYLGHVAQEQGNFVDAEEMLMRSMTLFREQGSTWGCAESLNCLGDLQRELGRYAEATVMLEEALVLRRTVNNQRGISATLCNLGHALCRQGDAERATACFRESLEIAERLHNKLFRTNCVIGFADIAGVQGKARQSALLLGAACRLLAEAGYELEPPDRVNYELVVAQARAQLAEGVFEAAWDEGSGMSLEQTLVYALEWETK